MEFKITCPGTKRARAKELKKLVKAYDHCQHLSSMSTYSMYMLRMFIVDRYSDLLITNKAKTAWYFKYRLTTSPSEVMVAFTGGALPVATVESFKQAAEMWQIFANLEAAAIENVKEYVIDMIIEFFEKSGLCEWTQDKNENEQFVIKTDHNIHL